MPRNLLYDSVDEANNRLAGTVVTYEGRPVLVNNARHHPDGVFRLDMLEHPFNGASTRKRIDSPAFNRFRTPPIGFCNYFDSGSRHALYCQRTSPRSRRQGLANENFSGTYLVTGTRERFDRLMPSDAFREMIEGVYPTAARAMEMLVPDSSIAVSREFALVKSEVGFATLMHKLEAVGIFFRDSLYLSQKSQFLQETILEDPNLPNRVEIL